MSLTASYVPYSLDSGRLKELESIILSKGYV